ncbi:MAG: ATP-binding protein [Verrucomicrobiales bacterium]|nr:ATP-binding protein [Verrucomicrobiales bacterium]
MKSDKILRFGKARLFATSVLFGIAVLVLLGISIYAWVIREDLIEARTEAQYFRGVSQELNDLRALALSVETSQRGYLITGTESYLEAYEVATDVREKATIKLTELLEGRDQFEKMFPDLISLIKERERDLKRAAELRKTLDISEVSDAVLSDSARQLNLKISGEFVRLTDVLENSQEEAEADYQALIDRLMFLLRVAAFTALGSGLVGLVFLLGHVREQQRAIALEEEKRRAEQSDREKSKFLASMNHEIRTPLNAMLGFSELLDSEVTSSRGKRFLSAIQTSGESLAELINDILDLSKIESGALDLDPEPVHLKEFAAGIAVMFEEQASQKGLDFSYFVTESSPDVILVDGLRLRQILINLIGNSMKFTEAGFIEMRILTDRVNSSDKSHCRLVLEVEDSGRGVEPSKKKVIFKPFRQARSTDDEKGGTGLGLSICRELAVLMGGKISLESEVGKGSVFTVSIPEVEICEEHALPQDVDSIAKDFNDLPQSKVLVVDDNPYNRELLGSFLEDTHHEVYFAEDGAEALEKMREVFPDLVLMDIRMPVMTGDEARQKMLEDDRLSTIPVIAVTASSLMSQEKRLRRMFDGYLRKPFSGTHLFEGMRSTLKRRRPRKKEGAQSGEAAAAKTSIKDSKALVEKLESLEAKRWKELTDAMVFSDVFAAADEIEYLGKEHEAEVLHEYAAEMRKLAREFNQSKLEQLLTRFRNLIVDIKDGGAVEDNI